DELPDDDTRVMVALLDPNTSEPVFAAHAGGCWWNDDAALVNGVYAWAHIPGLPPKKSATPASTLKPLLKRPVTTTLKQFDAAWAAVKGGQS
ncbi:MAG: hypothetical protein NTV51_10630, partial [Verrucomicrobia bacterium]|nr:hypothetical protein [Verrucomicrobiota bacterium]